MFYDTFQGYLLSNLEKDAELSSTAPTLYHTDESRADMKSNERDIKAVMDAMETVSNLFSISLDKLHCISSGQPITGDVASDILYERTYGLFRSVQIIQDKKK